MANRRTVITNKKWLAGINDRGRNPFGSPPKDNSTTGRNLSPSSAQPWRHRKRPELEPQGDPEAGSEGQKRPELEQQDDKARRESRSDVAAITYIPLGAQRIRETTAVAHTSYFSHIATNLSCTNWRSHSCCHLSCTTLCCTNLSCLSCANSQSHFGVGDFSLRSPSFGYDHLASLGVFAGHYCL